MPTYQYACTACGHQLEAVQSFTDPALTQCPVCDGRLRKLFSAVGIVFKGSGFYRNDSRSGPTGAESGSKDGAAKEGAAKETKTTEAKPSTDSSSATPASSSSSGSNGSSSGGSSSGSSSGSSASGSSSSTKAATTK